MQTTTKARAWLQLVRAPNLLTVPGDPIAGAMVAGGGDFLTVSAAAGIALSLYAAGLITNDLADFEEDRRERPERPLPSGAVSRTAAAATAVALIVVAMGLAAWAGWRVTAVAGALLALITGYNFGLKRIAVLGPSAMGACRGSSFLLGAAVAGGFPQIALWGAGVVAIYIALVTAMARREMEDRPRGLTSMFPVLVPVALIAVNLFFLPEYAVAGTAVLIVWAVMAWRVADRKIPTPRAVGVLIRCLLFFQAYVCLFGGRTGLAVALALILSYPASAVLGKRFYAS